MKLQSILKTADFVTLGNLIFGMLSIFASINKSFTLAMLFMLLAVACDFFDGKFARLSKKITQQQKDFGKQLDSLADLVSFGVAPAVFGFMMGLSAWYALLILVLFVCAGLLRLARFNILPTSDYFVGVAITTNGILFPLLYFVWLLIPYPIELFLVVYLFMAFAMMSSVKVRKVL